ncbi:MAG: HPP family protein [Methylobacterium sp.]|uniref:HPP family protein n=1 Tax=Methylobacterium sp. TaxID=409 RepID=UPI0027181C65|nr:HPP family protein [Methylobacterium sp.]MDO9427637.1 HPP family protein [Methylobacterium sp.]
MRLSLRHLLPDTQPLSRRERLRSAAGALVGILVTGLVGRLALGADPAWPALIAPMGASAVLLFAVPASPLAQPWSILGGNLVAALVGVTAAQMIADPAVAAAVAIGVAIGLMTTLRCLHPPSGAVALTAVLGGPAIHDLGYGFVLWPVAANSLLLLAVAILFNNLTGRAYPHAGSQKAADPAPSTRGGVTTADLDAVLDAYDQVLDIGRDDLKAILAGAQLAAYRRRAAGPVTCAAIMSRHVVAVAPHAPLHEALDLLRRHRVKALPVTDEGARILGIVTQTDLLDKTVWERPGPRLGIARRVALTLARGRAPHGSVEDIMTSPVRSVRPDTPIADLVPWMQDAGLTHLPVVGPDDRLVGIVSQADLVAELLAEAVGARRANPEPALA